MKPVKERPLLSVLLPVYNRQKYIENLLEQFTEAFNDGGSLALHKDKIELVLTNNKSSDESLRVAQGFSNRLTNLRIFDESEHVPTAEESFFRGFGRCLGTYVWALGSDDIPVLANLSELIDVLRAQDLDFLVANFTPISEVHGLDSYAVVESESRVTEIPILQLAQRVGLWYVMAGTSSLVMRTELVAGFDLNSLAKRTSPIYAHVIAYLEIFHDRKCGFLSFPLVLYKVNKNDLPHWRAVAAKFNVFDEFFWTLGFIRQLNYLEDKNIVSRDFFRNLLDRNNAGIYRPIFVVLDKLTEQLRIMSSDRSARNAVSKDDFREIADYLISHDPLAREATWSLLSAHTKLSSGGVLTNQDWTDISIKIEALRGNDLLFPFFVEKYKGYLIYSIQGQFYGVWKPFKSTLESFLRYVSTPDREPILIRRESRSAVRETIDRIGQNQELAETTAQRTNNHLTKFSTSNHEHVHFLELALERSEQAAASATAELNGLKASLSWRITAPLRKHLRFLKPFLRR